jgi:hypothetical protein
MLNTTTLNERIQAALAVTRPIAASITIYPRKFSKAASLSRAVDARQPPRSEGTFTPSSIDNRALRLHPRRHSNPRPSAPQAMTPAPLKASVTAPQRTVTKVTLHPAA